MYVCTYICIHIYVCTHTYTYCKLSSFSLKFCHTVVLSLDMYRKSPRYEEGSYAYKSLTSVRLVSSGLKIVWSVHLLDQYASLCGRTCGVYTYMYVCECVCCMYVYTLYLYMYIRICIYTYTYSYTYALLLPFTYIFAYHVNISLYTLYTYSHILIPIYTYVCIYTYRYHQFYYPCNWCGRHILVREKPFAGMCTGTQNLLVCVSIYVSVSVSVSVSTSVC